MCIHQVPPPPPLRVMQTNVYSNQSHSRGRGGFEQRQLINIDSQCAMSFLQMMVQEVEEDKISSVQLMLIAQSLHQHNHKFAFEQCGHAPHFSHDVNLIYSLHLFATRQCVYESNFDRNLTTMCAIQVFNTHNNNRNS